MTLVGEGKKYPFTLTVNGLEPNREYWSKHFPEISAYAIPDCEDVGVTPQSPYVQAFGRSLRHMYPRPTKTGEVESILTSGFVTDYADGGYVPNSGIPIALLPGERLVPAGASVTGRAAMHSLNETEEQTKRAVFGCAIRRFARTFCNSFRDELDELWPLARFAIMYGGSALVLYWIVVAVSWMAGNG